jgi:general secretion pathway protein G
MRKRAGGGFTLVEVLIVTAIIGIIAAIAIPNLMVAMGRAQQKSTMGEIRTYGTYLQMYVTDNSGDLPDCHEDTPCVWGTLNPIYTTRLQQTDSWGIPFIYRVLSLPALTNYEMRSLGSDGIEGSYMTASSPPNAVELDIVMRDGLFLQQ